MNRQKTILCDIGFIIPETNQEIRMRGNINHIKWNQFKKKNEQKIMQNLNQRFTIERTL